MGCKPSKQPAPSTLKLASSFHEISMNSQDMLARDILKESYQAKLTRAKVKLKLMSKLKKNLSS